jgi:uncharacterized protein YndB with AHSA1/START domain
MKITVSTIVNAPLARVWSAYTTADDIERWSAAPGDLHTLKAAVDLRVGGVFSARLEANDGSEVFDFAGTYIRIVPEQLLEMSLGDRTFLVEFFAGTDGVMVRVTGDAESGDEVEPQRFGLQESLDDFASYVEARQ